MYALEGYMQFIVYVCLWKYDFILTALDYLSNVKWRRIVTPIK